MDSGTRSKDRSWFRCLEDVDGVLSCQYASAFERYPVWSLSASCSHSELRRGERARRRQGEGDSFYFSSPLAVPTLPIELTIEIIKLYFDVYSSPRPHSHRRYSTLPHAASLRLVSSTFHDYLDVSLILFRTVTLCHDRDWLRYFDPTKGVLVTGAAAAARLAAVEEIVFSFSHPELPLKNGLKVKEVGNRPDEYIGRCHEWFAPLRIPLFSPSVRYVDLQTTRQNYEAVFDCMTQYACRLKRVAWRARELDDCVEKDRFEQQGMADTDSEGETDGGGRVERDPWRHEVDCALRYVERNRAPYALRTFFFNKDAQVPTSYASISLNACRLHDLDNTLYGYTGAEGDFIPGVYDDLFTPDTPDPFAPTDPSDLPSINLYPDPPLSLSLQPLEPIDTSTTSPSSATRSEVPLGTRRKGSSRSGRTS
jgi:hypothetical protein